MEAEEMTMPVRDSRVVQRIRAWPRRVLITVSVLVVLLIAARVAAPYMIKAQVNKRLESIPGYAGHVDNIRLHLLRGAYSLHGVSINRMEDKVREPFVLAKDIDFSIAWRELVHRKIVSDIVIDNLQIVFVKGPTKESSQTDTDRRWQAVVKDIFPIDITYLEIKDGAVRYVDNARQPPADVFVKNMHVVATGLRNRAGEGGGEMPAQINIDGDTLGGGRLTLSLAAEPLAEQPHFHLSCKLDDVNLPALNESLKAYANVDVGRGTFRLAAEMAGKDGGFQGYVKPFFENLDFHNLEDKHKNVGTRLWERAVAGLAWLVKNKPRDQVGTRVPFEGRFGDPKLGMLTTITNTLRHGFIRAFNPVVEGTVRADNVLPNGKSANGKDVSAVKTDTRSKKDGATDTEENKAGAPTGRPSTPKGK
jgi:hypothetical protein